MMAGQTYTRRRETMEIEGVTIHRLPLNNKTQADAYWAEQLRRKREMNPFYCPEYPVSSPCEELVRPCECDKCMGACDGGRCGECFACEAKADDDKWWAVNRADVLQV